MKRHVLTLFVMSGLLTGSVQSFAASGNCISNERDIPKVQAISQVVSSLGGIGEIEGTWKLGGLPGMMKNVEVHFASGSKGLSAEVDGLQPDVPSGYGNLTVCSTSQEGLLMVTVNNKGSLYLQDNGNGSMNIAQIKKGQSPQYYEFDKQ